MAKSDQWKSKCNNCGKLYGDHQANTNNCPIGKKTKIGYTQYHKQKKFENNDEKDTKGK